MAAPEGNQYAAGNDGGRPSKYKKEYADQAFKLCLLGHTDEELADFFEVDERTVNNWKQDYEEFFQSVIRGKAIADAEVAYGLFRRATGYEYNEVTFEKNGDKLTLEVTPDGELTSNEAYKKKIVTKMLPPDPGAAMNWLKNRQKTKWRDRTEHQLSGPNDGPIQTERKVNYDDLSDEELDAIIARGNRTSI